MPATIQTATICPACGGANNCALAAGNTAEQCWCMRQTMDRAVLASYRDTRRCLCLRCGTGNQNQDLENTD